MYLRVCMRVCGILCARLYIFKRFQPKSWKIVLIMIYIINWWRLRFSIRIVCMYTAHCAGDSMQQKCNCRCVHVFMVFKIKIYKNKIYSAGSYDRWAKCGMNTAWKTIFNSECLYRHCSHLENGKKWIEINLARKFIHELVHVRVCSEHVQYTL